MTEVWKEGVAKRGGKQGKVGNGEEQGKTYRKAGKPEKNGGRVAGELEMRGEEGRGGVMREGEE